MITTLNNSGSSILNLNLITKDVRSRVIKEHLQFAGLPLKVVCFSCGNAAKALQAEGVQVVYVGDNGVLQPRKWFSYTEISHAFNGLFDATSGHLPLPLLAKVAERLKRELASVYAWQPNYKAVLNLPTGSGETFVCLRWAYPALKIAPIYGDSGPTKYNPLAPLNGLVTALKNT